MIDGVVQFPGEIAHLYRDRGYWVDKSLACEFGIAVECYRARIALVDGDRSITYGELDILSDNLALNLLEMGLAPLDRVVLQLPNIAEFVILYIALQKIGAIPVAALVSHRYAEINQFVRLSTAVCCVVPDSKNGFEYTEMVERISQHNSSLRYRIVLGTTRAGFHSLFELLRRPATLSSSTLRKIRIDPTDPAIFQLSGGTTAVPKLIPHSHNEYAYSSKVSGDICNVRPESVLLIVLPIAHNLPLATPGFQGFLFRGGKVVISSSTGAMDILSLIQKHQITHLKVVPSLLIRLLNNRTIAQYDISSVQVIQCGGQRLQPEIKLRASRLFPNAFVQENFGMAEGFLMFVRHGDPKDVVLETVGRPASPGDEVRLVDENLREVPFGTVGELCFRGPYALRGYFGVPDYNSRVFTPDGFCCSGDLMRQHPSGNYIVQGRKKDLINRGGEKISAEEIENLILSHPLVTNVACVAIPDPDMGERMCACIVLREGASLSLKDLTNFLLGKDIAKYKLPEHVEILNELPLSPFGKVAKNTLAATMSARVGTELRSAPSISLIDLRVAEDTAERQGFE